jgi:Leu/Phe-tRNA-protein transferase
MVFFWVAGFAHDLATLDGLELVGGFLSVTVG